MLNITGTFLDEISYDIPHQNWGRKEWERDFAAMKSIGIDTVVMIRCGLRRFMTYPSDVLKNEIKAFTPPEDLVAMFLDLAEANDMQFFFGTYDHGLQWNAASWEDFTGLNCRLVEEAWKRYGSCKAFKGWYLSVEISRDNPYVARGYDRLGKRCKELSGGLPVLISPYIQGSKSNDGATDTATHAREWNSLLAQIKGAVDILAFQDGHCEYDELPEYLRINSELAARYDMQSWTNCETFDRDMPIHFLPIKWEKMYHKLRAAEAAGMQKAITFEFSHFMSPNSIYAGAHGLFNRYKEYMNI